MDLIVALVVPFLQGDDAFALVADVDDHIVADDVADPALDDLVDLEVLLFGRQPVVLVGAGVVVAEDGFHLAAAIRYREDRTRGEGYG